MAKTVQGDTGQRAASRRAPSLAPKAAVLTLKRKREAGKSLACAFEYVYITCIPLAPLTLLLCHIQRELRGAERQESRPKSACTFSKRQVPRFIVSRLPYVASRRPIHRWASILRCFNSAALCTLVDSFVVTAHSQACCAPVGLDVGRPWLQPLNWTASGRCAAQQFCTMRAA